MFLCGVCEDVVPLQVGSGYSGSHGHTGALRRHAIYALQDRRCWCEVACNTPDHLGRDLSCDLQSALSEVFCLPCLRYCVVGTIHGGPTSGPGESYIPFGRRLLQTSPSTSHSLFLYPTAILGALPRTQQCLLCTAVQLLHVFLYSLFKYQNKSITAFDYMASVLCPHWIPQNFQAHFFGCMNVHQSCSNCLCVYSSLVSVACSNQSESFALAQLVLLVPTPPAPTVPLVPMV